MRRRRSDGEGDGNGRRNLSEMGRRRVYVPAAATPAQATARLEMERRGVGDGAMQQPATPVPSRVATPAAKRVSRTEGLTTELGKEPHRRHHREPCGPPGHSL